MAAAFEDIRIIDFSQVLAGPFATAQLAELGADVIKIEQPVTGDQTRGLMAGKEDAGLSPSFLTCNIGKRSLTLNLKAPEATAIIGALVRTADVVVENFTPGVMDRLGFGGDALCAIKPDLIYCSISGYGQRGPKSRLAAYDGAIQAASGMMSITGYPDGEPTRTGYMPVDMATALNAAFAIAAALYRRRATGQGQRLDVAMMDTAMVVQAPQVTGYLVTGVMPERMGNRSPTRQPTANVFPTADGYVQVVALKANQVERLFEVVGESAQYRQRRYDDADHRLVSSHAVTELLTTAFRRGTTASWVAKLVAAGVPAAEIRDFDAVVADPQFSGRNAFFEVASARRPGERVRVVGAGYTADRDGPRMSREPPRLGEHTDEILAEIGFERQQIDDLRQRGVV